MADLDIPPLFESHPHLEGRVARVALGTFPTRVERLRNLEKRLGFRSLWVKRDDLSGRLHGGNKVRKLEYLLAGVSDDKGQTVVAYGTVSSNWTLACAIYARYLGSPAHLLLFRTMVTLAKEAVFFISRDLIDGVDILASPALLPVKILEYLVTRSSDSQVIIMPPGGTSPTSVLGYVNAFLELSIQVRSGLLPMPDVIVLPLGTGGTAAGLAAGVVLTGGHTRVIGVRVASSLFANSFLARTLANAALRIITRDGNNGRPAKVTRDVLQVDGRYYGSGYGRTTTAGEEAAKLIETEEGLTLDATYTAKAAASLLGIAGEGWGRDLNVLFWHTLNSIPLEKASEPFSCKK